MLKLLGGPEILGILLNTKIISFPLGSSFLIQDNSILTSFKEYNVKFKNKNVLRGTGWVQEEARPNLRTATRQGLGLMNIPSNPKY